MDILSMTPEEIEGAFKENSIPRFRARQVFDWLHNKFVLSYDEMTNLPKDMRALLAREFPITACRPEKVRVSKDGTRKILFSLCDSDYIESVVMKYKYGLSICVSSQVGCKMGCAFCASTIGGFKRSLTPGEILSQVYIAEKEAGERISHIVLMGMGEPLDNFDNVMRFLSLVTDERGKGLSMRNISLSTCGIVPGIKKLMEKHLQLTLSVSLHAPNDGIRNRIMPISRRYDMDTLLKACREYSETTSRRISYEYAMLSGINDSEECAAELASKLRGTLCHVNLIPVNEVDGSPFRPSDPETVKKFCEKLEKAGVTATVRRKLGSDIEASCGQLRQKTNKERGSENAPCS